MNFLITGASFTNKGAQSMLFSVMNEIRRKYKDAAIYYLPLDQITKYRNNRYKFILTYDDKAYKDKKDVISKLKVLIKSAAFRIRNREIISLSSAWKKIDVVLDVSGYQLTSNQSLSSNYRLVRYILSAQKNKIPVFLLPQSFGPFDYTDNNLEDKIKAALAYPRIIFAREKQGQEELKNKYGIVKNVVLSPDTVLQAKPLIMENIQNVTDFVPLNLSTVGNVGVIPNNQILIHGNESKVLNYYRMIIDGLLSSGKNIYVFRHSNDLDFCRKIKAMYPDDERVRLIEREFNCFEYSDFINNFDFIIASRYHSIIHAYKQTVPAIILGWAEKYLSLASGFSQERFVFDLTENIDTGRLKSMVDDMCINWQSEKRIIRENLEKYSINTCFDQIWSVVDETVGKK